MRGRNFLLGVNYWPRLTNIRMWRLWDEEAIKGDLDKMRELGLNSLRFFLLAEDFGDEEGDVKREALDKLEAFLAMAEERGLTVFPTLIVGHMSGKNWPIPWDPGCEVYEDAVRDRYVKFVKEVVRRVKKSRAIGGWILSNEITLVREPKSVEAFKRWLKALYEAVKSEDPNRPVSLGDSTSYLSSKLCLKPENVAESVDHFSPHLYLYDLDPVRHTIAYASVIEYCLSLGKPVVLEEFGYPTSLYSEESHARFIKVVLTLAFMLGAKGAFVWCYSDFPREGDEPYLWEPHELTFGLLRANGDEKPAAKAVKEFSEAVEEVGEVERIEREAAIMVPEHLYKDFPFHNLPRLDEGKALVESFVLAKGSSIPVTFVREEEDYGRFKLIIVPSISRLKTVTWRRLMKWVERGGVLYYSNARYLNSPHMSATHMWDELFGVAPGLRAGSPGLPLEPGELRIVEDLGPLRRGDIFTFKVATSLAARGLGVAEYELKDAKLVAVYNSAPSFTRVRRGDGMTVFSAYPLELMLAWDPMPDRVMGGYHLLYQVLADLAGLRPQFTCHDPRVEVEYARVDEGYVVAVINHSYEPVEVTITARSAVEVRWYRWGEVDVRGDRLRVRVGAKSVVLFKAVQ